MEPGRPPAYSPDAMEPGSTGAGSGLEGVPHHRQEPGAGGEPGLAPAEPGQGAQFAQGLKAQQLDKLKKISLQYELHGGAISALRVLEDFDIVVLVDDSGSMNTAVSAGTGADPFGARPTRWQELKHRVLQILQIATALDDDGIDLYFLNRVGAKNVTDEKQVEQLFKERPSGYTPLRAAYNRIMEDRSKMNLREKRTLIIIATDGEPNAIDSAGTLRVDSKPFAALLKKRPKPSFFPVVIMACTDNDDEIAWMNGLDDEAPNVDVVDDYFTEKKEIQAIQGSGFKFTRGDYVVKTLLGAINPVYDQLDEVRLKRKELAAYLNVPISELPQDKDSGGGCVCF
jgi:hypothetical protein